MVKKPADVPATQPHKHLPTRHQNPNQKRFGAKVGKERPGDNNREKDARGKECENKKATFVAANQLAITLSTAPTT